MFNLQDFQDDFWSKRLIVNDCWEWQGKRHKVRNAPNGYGEIYFPPIKRTEFVHRLAWSFANNKPLPKNRVVMHLCDNTVCFNPDHLKIGTYKDNYWDAVNKGRLLKHKKRGHRNHGNNLCINGHLFTQDNTILVKKDGVIIQRRCKICRLASNKRGASKNK